MNHLVLVNPQKEKVQNLVDKSDLNQQFVDDVISIRGCNYHTQAIEKTVKHSHPSLKPSAGVVFSVEVNYQERLVVLQEVKRSYSRIFNADEVIKAIRSAVLEEHELQFYAVVFLKAGSILKDSTGKIDYHACRNAFLNTSLDAIHNWTVNPQQDLQQLQKDVDALLEQMQLFVQSA